MGTRGPIKAGVAKSLPGLMRSGLVSIDFVGGQKTLKTYVFPFCCLNKLAFDLCVAVLPGLSAAFDLCVSLSAI